MLHSLFPYFPASFHPLLLNQKRLYHFGTMQVYIYSFNLKSNLHTQFNISSWKYVPLGQSSRGGTTAAALLSIFFIFMYFLGLWQAQRNERESIRQKLALGSFYDDEPVIYTSCSKNGQASRWVSIKCVYGCVSVWSMPSFECLHQYFCVLGCDSWQL